jgi:hypothetical protein
MNGRFIVGTIQTETIAVPLVASRWSMKDRMDTMKVRWSIGRMRYTVSPGLYAIGSPDRSSLLFVTANYKLSFDHLRRALEGLNAWILVLNTKGINVWCAAGKKTFGTKEIIFRLQSHQVDRIIDHRKIIVPQLGAPGVAAHEVRKETGFSVIYGPVRAADIKEFIEAGLKATDSMRTITFPLKDRLKLIPVDLFYGKYYLILIPACFLILSGVSSQGYSTDLAVQKGWKAVVMLYAGYLSGTALTPALLPWLPFRRFAVKGVTLGILITALLFVTGIMGNNLLEIASWLFMISGLSSFMAMNFTGSSTFTSLSGVQKEMKVMFPVQMILAGAGLIAWIVARFITR